ncbi:restriction endonuclease [Helicobacter bilis]|uniref:restriction endonuclease n=1 Tax=Helicobacter bilis TaxID=37372 RepID=UPI002942287A|nr:restriction endonuclease [Helicobacter bilis]
MSISALYQDKGEQYERLVAKYYRDRGYIVFKNSTKGKTGDCGLDLIAFSQKEDVTLLLQCKNQDPTKTAYYLKKDDVANYIKKFDEAYMYIKNYKQMPIEIMILALACDGESVYRVNTQAKNSDKTNSQ